METNLTGTIGLVTAIITGIISGIVSIVLSILELRKRKKQAETDLELKETELSPLLLEKLLASNKQEFEIMRLLNEDLTKKIVALETELNKHKLLYKELEEKYNKLNKQYDNLTKNCKELLKLEEENESD